MQGTRNKTSGFTLIELLITLSISAILVSLAIPSFAGIGDRARLITATRAVASDLRTARQLAMAKGIPVRLVLEVGSDRYHLAFGEGDKAFGGHDFKNPSEGFPGVRIAGFSNSACRGTITFSSRGTTACATTIILSTASKTRSITVVMTGRIRILP